MLNQEAKELYLDLTIISYDCGFINYFEMASRLRYLSSIIDDRELIQQLLQFKDPFDETKEEDSSKDDELFDTNNKNEKSEGFLIPDKSTSQNNNSILAFLTTSNGILGGQWCFHQYDHDYFPSIPHGHLWSNKKKKLDSYRGFTFDTSANNKPLKREKRKFIINLWNDPKFRTFANNHIEFYIAKFPNHNWRVKNRLRIPRKDHKRLIREIREIREIRGRHPFI